MIYRVGGRGQFGGYWRCLPWARERGFPSAPDFSPARDYCPCPEEGGVPSGQDYTPLPKPTQIIICGPAWRFIKAIYEGGCG